MRRDAGLAWVLGTILVLASVIGIYLVVRDDGAALLELLGLLEHRVAEHPAQAMTVFMLIMVITTCLTLPTATLLCLSAGFLFGTATGAALSVASALGGATLTFLAIRFIAGERVREFFLRGRTESLLLLLERDAFFYLMALRIVPVAPFFAINAAGGMIRISLPRFMLATGLGLAPIMLVYASVGAGVESLVDANRVSGFELVTQPRVLLPLLALLILMGFGALARNWVRALQLKQPN